MVRPGQGSLDYADHWLWYFWIRYVVQRYRTVIFLILFSVGTMTTLSVPTFPTVPLGPSELMSQFYSIPIQLYLVDTFKYAASALAAASVCSILSRWNKSLTQQTGLPFLTRVRIPFVW